MIQERFTFMQHNIRKHFKLSMEEYSVLDAIYCLSRNQSCDAKAEYFVNLFDISERSYYNIRKTLFEKGLIAKTGNGVKTTQIWDDAMISRVAPWPDSISEESADCAKENSFKEENPPKNSENSLQNLQSDTAESAETAKNTENDCKNCSESLQKMQSDTAKFAVHNIEINKEINNINNIADGKDLELSAYHEIDKIFRIGSEKLTGQAYYRDAKEAKHIKLLEARYKTNPDEFKKLAFKFLCMIDRGEDDFYNTQPFTPAVFNSLYNRIQGYQLSANTRRQQEQKKRSEWDELLDRYGNYNDSQLKYFLRCKQLSQEEYEFLKSKQLKVVEAS